MKIKKSATLLTLIVLILVLVTSCTIPLRLRVTNQTDWPVTMCVSGGVYFEVLPHQTAEGDTAPDVYTSYLIEGIKADGEVIYSRIHEKVYGNDVEITITPTETDPYLPLEVENRTRYPIWIEVNSVMITYLMPCATIKKKPLPSDNNTYVIKAMADRPEKIYISIYEQTLNRSELEKLGWKLTITGPVP